MANFPAPPGAAGSSSSGIVAGLTKNVVTKYDNKTDKLIDSSIIDGDKLVLDKPTQVANIVVTGLLSARELKTTELTLNVGSGLGLSAIGGEAAYIDKTTPENTTHFGPRKQVDVIGGTGTANNFTLGRIIGPFVDIEVQPVSTLRSDDPTAQVGENAFDSTNVEFLFTTDDDDDFLSRLYRFRFITAATGNRYVVRKGSRTGAVVFASVEDFLWELGEGFTSQVYIVDTPATESILDLNKHPQIFRKNTLYHITLEKFEATVVTLGTVIDNEFITYFSRQRADALVDPVVATAVITVTDDLAMIESDWYTVVFIDAANGPVDLTLPSASAGIFSGLPMYIIRIDTSANEVNVLPFAGQNINGETSIPLARQYESITLFPDGDNVKIASRHQLFDAGDILFADTNGEPITNPLLRWDNAGDVFLVEKTSIGLAAVLGNAEIANNGPDSFTMRHRDFGAADVDVGFGQDNVGKISIGSAGADIALSTGTQGNILGLSVVNATGNTVIEGQVQIKGGTQTQGNVLTLTGADGLCTFEAFTAGASGTNGAIQFAAGGNLSSDVTNFSWNNSTKALTLGKTTSGLVANFGNARLRNRDANDFSLKHKLFNGAEDDNVGYGHNTGGKITIGASMNNSIDFMIGEGTIDVRTAPVLVAKFTLNEGLEVIGNIKSNFVGGLVETNNSQKPAQNTTTAIQFDEISEGSSMSDIAFTAGTNQTLFTMPFAGFLRASANFHFERTSTGGANINYWMWFQKDTNGNGVFASIGYGRHKPLATQEHDVSVITLSRIAVGAGDRIRVVQRTDGIATDGVGLLQGAPGFMSPAQVVGCALALELTK